VSDVSSGEQHADAVRAVNPLERAEAVFGGEEAGDGFGGQLIENFEAGRARKLLEQRGAAEARGQPIEEFSQRSGAGRKQGAQQREEGIAGGEGTQAGQVRTQQEAAVGLPAADDLLTRSQGGFHAGDNEGRTDACFGGEDGGEAAAVNGIVAADGDDNRAGAEILGYDHAEQVPAEKPQRTIAVYAQQQGAVTVSIGRGDGVVRPIDERLNGGQLRGFDVFGVDGDEGFAAAGRDDFGAEALQQGDEQVAAHGGMLIDEDAFARQRLAGEEDGVALKIKFGGLGAFGRQRGGSRFEGAGGIKPGVAGRLLVEAIAPAGDEGVNWLLVMFEQFAARGVQLVPVAIKRDVAAGDHERGLAAGEGIGHEGRGRDAPAVDRNHAAISDRLDGGGGQRG